MEFAMRTNDTEDELQIPAALKAGESQVFMSIARCSSTFQHMLDFSRRQMAIAVESEAFECG
jgi:hypothetical protein